MRLRDEYISSLRGLDPLRPLNPELRVSALNWMQSQQAEIARAAQGSKGQIEPLISFSTWTEIGPRPVPNGQTQQFPAVAPVTGRATMIVVDPTNSNKIYLGAAQGGVWRSLDGGLTWSPIFDTAQSLSIGALALYAVFPREKGRAREAEGQFALLLQALESPLYFRTTWARLEAVRQAIRRPGI